MVARRTPIMKKKFWTQKSNRVFPFIWEKSIFFFVVFFALNNIAPLTVESGEREREIGASQKSEVEIMSIAEIQKKVSGLEIILKL